MEHQIQNITKMNDMTPLCVKVLVESSPNGSNGKPNYDDINKCCICLCELYDGLEQKSLREVEEMERDVMNQQQAAYGMTSEMLYPVVQFSNCSGDFHGFHFECIVNYAKSQNGDKPASELTFMKCAGCNKVYGKQMGDMPAGTMTW